ncbi:MAG: DUF11 domain-containing protein, partial [Bacteroidetes bacterium]
TVHNIQTMSNFYSLHKQLPTSKHPGGSLTFTTTKSDQNLTWEKGKAAHLLLATLLVFAWSLQAQGKSCSGNLVQNPGCENQADNWQVDAGCLDIVSIPVNSDNRTAGLATPQTTFSQSIFITEGQIYPNRVSNAQAVPVTFFINDQNNSWSGNSTSESLYSQVSHMDVVNLGYNGGSGSSRTAGSGYESFLYGCDDSVRVEMFETYGGCNGTPDATLTLPTANVFDVVVEIVYKGGNPGDLITIGTSFGDFNLPRIQVSGTSRNVYIYRGVIPGNPSYIEHEAGNKCRSFQSMVAYTFANTTDRVSYSGELTTRSGYCDYQSFSIPVPANDGPRDIFVTVPVSEVTDDGRFLTVTASAGGVSDSETITGPYLPCCFAAIRLELLDVPGHVTSVLIEVDTRRESNPNGNSCGQSYVIGGLVWAEIECTCSTEAGTIAADQNDCFPYDPVELTGTAITNATYQWQYRTRGGTWINLGTEQNQDIGLISELYEVRRLARESINCPWNESNIVTLDGVNNITDPGAISGDEERCGAYDPAAITGTSASGGRGGAIIYRWQERTYDCATGNYSSWSWVAGNSNTPDYDPPAITSTTQYRRFARRASCSWAASSNVVTKRVVENLTDNSISGGDTYCDSGDPPALTGDAPSTGCFGTLEYQWQTRTRNGDGSWPAWSNISGATARTYNPGTITATTQYRRLARLSPCGWVHSNSVTFRVNSTPVARISGGTGGICSGETKTFSAVDQGTGTTYSWDFGANASPATATGAGPHTVTYSLPVSQVGNMNSTVSLTVTRAGCTASDQITFTVLDSPEGSLTSTDPGCDADDGTITITFPDNPSRTAIEFSIDGGTSWPASVPDNSGSYTFTGLAAGTYQVWSRWGDDSCPVSLGGVILVDQEGPNAALQTTINPDCHGAATGRIIVAIPTQGTAPFTYAISPQNGLVRNDRDFYDLPAGTYTFTVTDANGCTATVSHTLMDPPALVATAGADVEICYGNSTSLSVTSTGGAGSVSYSWNPGGLSGASPTVSPTVTTTYTVTATDAYGCTATDQMTITVKDYITDYGTISSDQSNCGSFDPAELTGTGVTATGSNYNLSYQWQSLVSGGSWTNISGATGQNYDPLTLTETTQFRRRAFAGNGCGNGLSNVVTITVNPVPTASIDGNPLVCDGQTTTLTASGAGTGGSYNWSTGDTGSTITVTPSGINQIQVTVTNANGCTDVASIVVSSTPRPSVVAASAELCVGESTTLTASGGVTYQWSANAGGGTSNVTTVTPAQTTTYSVTVTNAAGCSEVASVTVTVLELPVINSVNGTDPTACDGSPNGSLTVSATGNSGTLQYRINGGSWQASHEFNNLAAGTYNVEVSYTGARCVVGPETVTLNAAVPPVAEAGPNATICAGESTTLNGSATGGTGTITYSWMPGNLSGASPTVSPASTTTYTLTATDQYGCSATDQVTVTVHDLPVATASATNATCGTDNGTITFTFPDNSSRTAIKFSIDGGTTYPYSSADNAGSLTITDLAAGTYDLWVRWGNNECPVDMADVTIEQENGPRVSTAAALTICEGSTATLSATASGGTGTITYTWMPGNLSGASPTVSPLTTTTYTVTATDANGCTSTATQTVNVDAAIVSGINAPSTICAEEGVLFSADPPLTGATYAWSFTGPVSQPTATTASTTVQWDTPGNYQAQLIVTQGTCTETYMHDIEITTAVFAASNGDQSVCQGGSVVLGLPEGQGGPVGATYTWTPNLFLDNPNIAQPTATPPFDITYTLTVEQNGCVRTEQVQVRVDVSYNPIADAGSDQEVCVGEMITLGGSPTGTPPPADPGASIISYAWTPTTGLSDPTAANPTVTITSTQTYQVVVTATGGCTDTASVTVTPMNCGSIGDFVWEDLNGDGMQDSGEVGIAGVTVNLLDGSGTQIATTTTAGDGSYLFGDLPSGSYIVEVLPATGYAFTVPNNVSDALDSDMDPVTGQSDLVTINGAQNVNHVDAGLYQPISIGDYAWVDFDGDGYQDGDESGLAGVNVSLLDDNGNTVQTTTTDGSGAYLFTNVAPGEYQLSFTAPTDFEFTLQNSNGDGDVGANNDLFDSDVDPTTGLTSTFIVQSGDAELHLDAGLHLMTAGVGNWVWNDIDGNGQQDAAEEGLAGITVNLYRKNLSLVGSLSTDTDGSYSFNNLAPGAYFLEFVPPAGFYRSQAHVPGDDAMDSDADINTGRTPIFNLLTGQQDDTQDAGFHNSADISLRKMEPSGPVTAGDQITFYIELHNAGPDPATSVSVKDYLPAGLTDITSISDNGSLSNGEIEWTGIQVPLNGTYTLTYQATVAPTGPYTNIAEVTASAQDDIDSTPNNGADVSPGNGIGSADPDSSQDMADEDDADDAMMCPLGATIDTPDPVCAGDAVTLTVNVTGATGNLTYLWTPSGLTTATITVTPPATPGSYTYSVDVTDDASCTVTASVQVTVLALPTVTFSGDQEICSGESTTITASGGTSYLWSTGATTPDITVSPTNTGPNSVDVTYTVTVTDGNSCSTVASVPVTVHPNPTASLVGNPTVCEKQATTLTASGAGPDGSYAWNTGDNTATITVTPQSIVTYTVTVTDQNTCVDSISVTVTPAPEPIVIAASTEICSGDNETVTLTASGGTTYQWDADAGNATTASVDVTPIVTTVYDVTVTDDNGCSAASSVTITVLEQPVITSIDVVQPTSCNGTDNGQITV